MNIIFVQIYLSHTKFSSFAEFFFQICLKFAILSSSLIYTFCQNFETQKIVLCDNNFGKLECVYAHHENPYLLDAFKISRRKEQPKPKNKRDIEIHISLLHSPLVDEVQKGDF